MIRLASRGLWIVTLTLLTCTPQRGSVSTSDALFPSLERLYSQPNLLGTEPGGAVWSADSTKVAFLWNQDGLNFRDVWLADAADPNPQRLTRLPRPAAPAGTPGSPAFIRAQVGLEQHRGATSLCWKPDGTAIYFNLNGELYVVDLESDVQKVSRGAGTRGLAFSGDGQKVAFQRGRDLWIAEIEGARLTQARQLTQLEPGIVVERFSWSPKGTELLLLERNERHVPERQIPDYLTEETTYQTIRRPLPGEPSAHRRLGLYTLSSGRIRWLELGRSPEDILFSFSWSPQGSRIAVDASDLYVKHRRILVVDAQTGQFDTIYEEIESDNVTAYWQMKWGSEGQQIYFLSDRDDFYHVYRLSARGGEVEAVTGGDWAVESFHISGQNVFFGANRERPEERHIYRTGREGGEPVRISFLSGTHSPAYAPDGSRAVVHHSSDESPPDYLMIRLDAEQASAETEKRLTQSPLSEFAEYDWVKPHYVSFPSHLDGVEIQGRLLLPPNMQVGKKYPAILGSVYSNTLRNQWGGRNAHPVWGLDQYLLRQGYVLLTVDFRGSWGYGREFRRKLKRDYGGIDVEDIYSGVLYLGTQGYVDMNRVGIWGSSYGGLLTCMSLFGKPGVYKAGVAGAPATNVWHALTGEMRVMERPQDYPEEYADSSAFTHAKGLQDHLMIIHGMRDRIVMFKDSLALLQHLMFYEKADLLEFVPLPDSRHSWDNAGLYQTRFAYQKLVQHFERYLGTGPTP